MRTALAVVGLAVLLGTIVFAVRAAGRDPFGSANTANPQLERMAADLDRVATAVQGPTSTSTKQTASALAISKRYSHWRTRRTTAQQASADKKIPSELAGAFVTVAEGTLGPGTKGLLASLFSELLAPPGPQLASAAAGLASIASLLPAAQQALLPARLSLTMANALDGVVKGGSEEFGKRAIGKLFDWLGGSDGSASGNKIVKVEVAPLAPIKVKLAPPPPIKVELVPPAPVKVKLVPPPRVKIRLTPTSFIWGGQTWEWGELRRFKLAFAMEHKGETKACIAQQLVVLYERHLVVRRVFGIATPRRRPVVPCH